MDLIIGISTGVAFSVLVAMVVCSSKVGQATTITLCMGGEIRKRVVPVQKMSGSTSVLDVIRKALAVYDFCWEVKAGGGTITVRGPDGEKELDLK